MRGAIAQAPQLTRASQAGALAGKGAQGINTLLLLFGSTREG